MSSQTQQKMRRSMASPSTNKQGPMKATQSFGLMQGSPTASRSSNGRKISPSSSPTTVWTSTESHRKTRRSPDLRSSPERCSPSSPCFKGDKAKTPLRPGHSPVSLGIKRTNSYDTVTSAYLVGEWPKDIPAVTYCDKSTQTPEEWDDIIDKKRKGSHKRSSSVGNGADTLREIKASLAKNRKEGSRGVATGTQRTSPIQGNHFALGSSAANLQSKSLAIPCQTPSRLNSRMKGLGSLEGLNQEIEKLTLRTGPCRGDCDEAYGRANAPDGHRAPVTELLNPRSCSVDTQTPSGYVDVDDVKSNESPSSGSSSRPQSESPSMPPMLVPFAADFEEKDLIEIEKGDSPDPGQDAFSKFVREPPDGCEKVSLKVDESSRDVPPLKEKLFCPIMKPSCVIPSQQSAFTVQCPLLKPYVNQPCDMAIKTSKSSQEIASGGSAAAT